MTTIAPKSSRPPATPLAAPEVYRLTVDEYERLAEANVLDDDRVELIDGYLVEKMPKKPLQVWVVDVFGKVLEANSPRWWCRREAPVRIPNFDEPEPDLSVIRGRRDDFLNRHPGPKDIALLVEVSDTTLARDRGEKWSAYARGRIPVYWIINLVDRQVEVYSNPRAGKYRSSQVYRPGQEVPVVIAGVEVGRVAVANVLPP
jgi:Uma2 family endonuclease